MRQPWVLAVVVLMLVVAACSNAPDITSPSTGRTLYSKLPATATVAHVVIVMMENRSFDSYFGTYPGVNGIPSDPNCNPDPLHGTCILPYHNPFLDNNGGPHGTTAFSTDLDGGKLDGFVISAETQPPSLNPNPDEVMSYHTCAEIPVYCRLARQGVLADNAFAATSSWSTMAHLYLVSDWSARCRRKGDPSSCVSDNAVPDRPPQDHAWTDMTWILHQHGISWGYYVYSEGHPLLGPNADGELPGPDDVFSKEGPWNPLPGFDDVALDGEIGNIESGEHFDVAAKSGTLPQVAWVVPDALFSDHPTASIANGQRFVNRVVREVEIGPDASSTLIVLLWDEWGGFYDHVTPPVIDDLGYGFRVPFILYGPMVKAGTIDHQLLSTDAVNKFIEDVFLGGERLDNNDGRPDPRPDVRENTHGLGDLRLDLK